MQDLGLVRDIQPCHYNSVFDIVIGNIKGNFTITLPENADEIHSKIALFAKKEWEVEWYKLTTIGIDIISKIISYKDGIDVQVRELFKSQSKPIQYLESTDIFKKYIDKWPESPINLLSSLSSIPTLKIAESKELSTTEALYINGELSKDFLDNVNKNPEIFSERNIKWLRGEEGSQPQPAEAGWLMV